MAPVTATNVGMVPQIMDSPELRTLVDTLNLLNVTTESAMPLMIETLVQLLEPHVTWRFQEQVRYQSDCC